MDKPQSRIVLEASAAGHDLNRGVTTLRKFIKPNDQSQPETKSTESQVGVDPFARHDSAAPVEIVVPEDDEAGRNSREIPKNSAATYIRRRRCFARWATIVY